MHSFGYCTCSVWTTISLSVYLSELAASSSLQHITTSSFCPEALLCFYCYTVSHRLVSMGVRSAATCLGEHTISPTYTTHTTSTNAGATGAGLEHQPATAGLGMSACGLVAITATIPSTRPNPQARVIRLQVYSTPTPWAKPFFFVSFFWNQNAFRPTC